MDSTVSVIFQNLGISLSLGMLVGLQRERSESVIAGLRTFPLITVLGTLAAMLDQACQASGWILGAGMLAVIATVSVTNLHRLRQSTADYGMTTEVAILVMYAVGAYLVMGERVVGVAIGASVAILLQFKPELHGIAARLGDQDLRAIMTFALITCIVLPVLPNRTYELVPPFDVLNPFEIWMMVVLMVGISLTGYLVFKFFGHNAGIILGGVLGGAISSTATTLSYSKRARSDHQSAPLASVVISIASSVVFVRVLIEMFAVAPQHFSQLAPPLMVMMISGVVAAGFAWWRVQTAPPAAADQRNPTELRSAVLFAALYAGVLLALSAVKTYLGGRGLYGVALLSGLTDMDAITLSTSRMVRAGSGADGIAASQGWRLIAVATMANLVFKWCMAASIGPKSMRRQLAFLFAVPLATGLLLIFFWPA